MSSTAEQLQKVKDWIVKACPDIWVWQCENCACIYAEYVNGCPRCWSDERIGQSGVNRKLPPIGIAEVLRTWFETDAWKEMEVAEAMDEMNELIINKWNLSDDNLDHQSPETISFLFNLIP